jgi:hypothetical protein
VTWPAVAFLPRVLSRPTWASDAGKLCAGHVSKLVATAHVTSSPFLVPWLDLANANFVSFFKLCIPYLPVVHPLRRHQQAPTLTGARTGYRCTRLPCLIERPEGRDPKSVRIKNTESVLEAHSQHINRTEAPIPRCRVRPTKMLASNAVREKLDTRLIHPSPSRRFHVHEARGWNGGT